MGATQFAAAIAGHQPLCFFLASGITSNPKLLAAGMRRNPLPVIFQPERP